jgi:hypothetical protein
MDLPKKDFGVLAAIGLTLRQFSVASRRRVIQTIVKVQLQLGVRAAGWRLDRRHDRHD